MEALLAFAAALVALRLAGLLARAGASAASRSCSPGAPVSPPTRSAAAAIAWGAAAGWNDGVFRAYYLCGGLLTAALLGAGSLLGSACASPAPVALVYTGLAVGVALGVPVDGTIAGTAIPEAQEHLEPLPGPRARDRRQRRGHAGADRRSRSRASAAGRSATC